MSVRRQSSAVMDQATGWAAAMADYFGVRLTDATADRWYDALRQQCRDLTDDELEQTIAWASFKDRSKFAGKPTLKDLRMWVFWRRKEERTGGTEEPGSESCEMCNSGWIRYEYDGGEMDTPCACSGGTALMEKLYKPDDHRLLRAQAKRAIEQETDRRIDSAVWTQAWIDAGKPSVDEIVDSMGKDIKYANAAADLKVKARDDRIEAMGDAWEPGDD